MRDRVVIATKFGFRIDPATGKQAGLDSRPGELTLPPTPVLPCVNGRGKPIKCKAPKG